MTGRAIETGGRRKPRDLRHDDHEAWEVLCGMLKDGGTFEDIAAVLGVKVDDLLHWSNCVYKPAQKPMTEMQRINELPFGSPVRRKLEHNLRVRIATAQATARFADE